MTMTPPTPSFSLADVIVAVQLKPAEVLLIRHPMSNLRVGSGRPSNRIACSTTPAARTKPVLAFAEPAVDPFPGFENVVLSFAELERVVAEPRRYALWHAALSAVNAVYLIVDTLTGKQYVGSAYGDVGLLARWKTYIDTFHGGNKLLVAELKADPATYSRFQFSVLQILPRSTTPEAVIAVEGLYKHKLRTKRFGAERQLSIVGVRADC